MGNGEAWWRRSRLQLLCPSPGEMHLGECGLKRNWNRLPSTSHLRALISHENGSGNGVYGLAFIGVGKENPRHE
jgi:hypothetical protein